MKKILLGLCSILFTLSLFSCRKNELPTNHLINLKDSDTIITVKNWQIVGPFFDEQNTRWTNISQAKKGIDEDSRLYSLFERTFKEGNNDTSDHLSPHSFLFFQKDHLQEYEKIFDTQKIASSYAATIINSETEQDVAFQMVMDDAVKVWVNKKLSIEQFQNEYITKNKYAYKVHLKKGENIIVVKLYNLAESKWGFNLNIGSVENALKYPSGKNYFSISDKYLLDNIDTLHLRLNYPSFFDPHTPVQVVISDVQDQVLIKKEYDGGFQWDISLKSLKKGAYKCKLITVNGSFEQKFIYGNFRKNFEENSIVIHSLIKKESEKINVKLLIDRFNYLDSFAKKNVYDEQMERKISNTLFEFAGVADRAVKHQQLFKGTVGLHLRSFKSQIDRSIDDYMLYVPEVDHKKKLPIVIVMPYVVGLRNRFIENFPVADLERTEMMQMFSNKYGIAILWPRARVVADYNLNPIVYKSTLEALNDVKQYYSIDFDRVFLMGSCSGGLQALLMANKFPSFFAALAVDGPELGYTTCEFNNSCSLPSEWTKQNNIFNTLDNYKNIPLYLFHSKNDEKANPNLTYKLISEIKKNKGSVRFNDLNNGIKQVWISMIPDNTIIGKTFAFFSNKKRINNPDTITYSTYQLKYNRAYWITIDDITLPGKATVRATIDHDIIKINTSNINCLTVNLSDLYQFKRDKKIKITLNGKDLLFDYPKSGFLKVYIREYHDLANKKNTNTEGPVNDVFASKFIIVKGTRGGKSENEIYKAAVDTLVAGWGRNLLSTCDVRNDTELKEADLKNNNLILVGSKTSNLIIRNLIKDVPLEVTSEYVKINGKSINGNNLSYAMLYPNPYNTSKYILIIGSNFKYFKWAELKNIGLEGWYDYEIWKQGIPLANGYFDRSWK